MVHIWRVKSIHTRKGFRAAVVVVETRHRTSIGVDDRREKVTLAGGRKVDLHNGDALTVDSDKMT